MTSEQIIDFSKHPEGLVPAVVQHYLSGKVLMLGYMNSEAFDLSKNTKQVTFYSRSKQRLWVKGETSGNFLDVTGYSIDCDSDAILMQASPRGVTCHTGAESCFESDQGSLISILTRLETLLQKRRDSPVEGSYSSKLLSDSLPRAAQKVGEEGVEVALASVVGDDPEFIGETADLWFHSLVLLAKRKISISEVLLELRKRNLAKGASDLGK